MKKTYLIYLIIVIVITIYLSVLIIERGTKTHYELITPKLSEEKIFINNCKEPCDNIGGSPNCPSFPMNPNSTFIYDGIKVCIPPTIVKINSHGFRDYEYSLDKPNNTFRIIVLGDSYTFGLGVELNDSYPKILEKLLNKGVGGWTYEVLNFGVPGSELPEKVELLSDKALFFNPDLLILQYEGTDIMNFTEKEQYLDYLTKEYLLKHNISMKELNLSSSLGLLHEANDLYLSNVRKKGIRPIIEKPLDNLANLISKEKRGFLILFLHTPNRDKLILEEISKKHGWNILNCNEYSSSSKFWIHEKDSHFNPLGNQLIAEKIYEVLILNKLLLMPEGT